MADFGKLHEPGILSNLGLILQHIVNFAEDLLSDWGQVTRALGIVPPMTQYKVNGKYSRNAFDRFGKWIDVPDAFRKYAESNGEWDDVLTILDKASLKLKKKPTLKIKARHVTDKKGLHEKL
jgi:hypothetical protein